MYKGQEERNVEKICYEQNHITKVFALIKDNFPKYFDDFLSHEAVSGISEQKYKESILYLA